MTASSFSNIVIPAQWQAALKRWINFHRVIWALVLASFFIAWNRGLALLYGLFSLLVALLLISYLMPRLQLRNIRASRYPKGDFTVGKPASITYQLETGRTHYHIELLETAEFGQEQYQHFFLNKISGRTSCTLQFNCVQRGCFRLKEIQLSSAYPFGIVRFSRCVQTEPIEILVFPRLVELSRIPAPIVAAETSWGDVSIAQKGGRDEYTGVREYCHGDELNRIHWPLSARHHSLVVKEYEKTDRPAMLVVLDCRNKFNLGEGGRSTFEYAITLAASMIRLASRQGLPCFLVAHDDRRRELAVPAFCSDLYALYELLARLNANGRHPYHSIVEQAHQRFPQANLITMFRLDSDHSQPDLPLHVTQIDLEMASQSFKYPNHPGPQIGWRRERNRVVYSVRADQNLENLFHEA